MRGRCFLPSGNLVAGDCMLAQKIILENCEEEALTSGAAFLRSDCLDIGLLLGR